MNTFLNWLKDTNAEGLNTYGNAIAIATLLAAVLALLYVIITAKKVLRYPEGNDTMIRISHSIRTGANAYLKRQYKIVGAFFLCMFILLEAMAFLGYINSFVPFAFVTGDFSRRCRDLSA